MWPSQSHPLEHLVDRTEPSPWSRFLAEPVLFLTRKLWGMRNETPHIPSMPITVVCISDTHNTTPDLPAGDILVHAGDLTENGTFEELAAQIQWLDSQPHQRKLVVAGNHDELLDWRKDPKDEQARKERERRRAAIMWGSVQYLEDSSTTVKIRDRELSVYGSPKTPRQGSRVYSAFNYDRCDDGEEWTGQIPPGTDILITHGPPKTHLDMNGIGCLALLEEIWRRRPTLHVFGHVHQYGGQIETLAFDGLQHKVEQTLLDRGGLANLLGVFWEWLKGMRASKVSKHMLVNAALLWGLKNEKKRKPIVVKI